MIAFSRRPKRPKRERTDVADRWIWQNNGSRFRLVKSRWIFGRPRRVVYFVQVHDSLGWDTLSTHRKRDPAERAWQRAERETPTPVPCNLSPVTCPLIIH